MSEYSEIFILVIGFIAITIISFIIAKRVKRYLSAKLSPYTFLIICLLGVYYIVDVSYQRGDVLTNYYFYFWLAVIVVQLIFFLNGLRRKPTDAEE